jgi:hypothetical protein
MSRDVTDRGAGEDPTCLTREVDMLIVGDSSFDRVVK